MSEIKLIKEREKKVLQDFNNGITITCALWAPMANYFDEATKRIQCFFETKNIKDVKYSEDTYSKMIKAIYSIDDIEDWKIEKKLEYMKNCSPKKIRFLNIKLPYPRFRFKQCNYNTVLIQGEILKKTIRDCFKNRISDYFYDILFHSCDNTSQSEFVNSLINPVLNLEDYFNKIQNYNYMIIKHETENMTDDFPKTLPFAKDTDIVCSEKDYNSFVLFSRKYFEEKFGSDYEIKFFESKNNSKIRIELNHYLIYQIDISTNIKQFRKGYIEEALDRKIKKKNFYIPVLYDELCFRLVECINYPNKKHHFNFVLKHKDKIDLCFVKTSIIEESYTELLNKFGSMFFDTDCAGV